MMSIIQACSLHGAARSYRVAIHRMYLSVSYSNMSSTGLVAKAFAHNHYSSYMYICSYLSIVLSWYRRNAAAAADCIGIIGRIQSSSPFTSSIVVVHEPPVLGSDIQSCHASDIHYATCTYSGYIDTITISHTYIMSVHQSGYTSSTHKCHANATLHVHMRRMKSDVHVCLVYVAVSRTAYINTLHMCSVVDVCTLSSRHTPHYLTSLSIVKSYNRIIVARAAYNVWNHAVATADITSYCCHNNTHRPCTCCAVVNKT